jgi:hypothetical protein
VIAIEANATDGESLHAFVEVTRSADVKRGSAILIIHWVMEGSNGVPEEIDISYSRTVDLLATYTSYSVQTTGARNGRVQQHNAEDTIHGNDESTKFGFASTFHISSTQARNDWNEGICYINIADGHQWHMSHCTGDMDEFTFDGTSSTSTMNSPGRFGMLGYSFVQGDVITVTP